MTDRIARIRDRLTDERGVVVPITLAVLLVALVLTLAAVVASEQANSVSNRDANSKSGLEAANAGLRTAVYRLDTYQPTNNNCPTPTPTGVGTGAPTSTLCAPQSQTMGNGASFTYWVSEAMQGSDTCTGPTVSSTSAGVAERCITSVGTANGINVRVQQRVAAYDSAPVFPAAIFGTNQVTVDNNAVITSDTPNSPALLGTNGTLNIATSGGGTTVYDGYAIGSRATVTIGGNAINTAGAPTTQMTTQYAVPTPAWPFNSQVDTAGPPYGSCSSNSTNCDYEIAQGITYSQCLNQGVVVANCDPSSGLSSADFTYPGSHILYLPNNSTLTLGGGNYYFCGLYLGNNSAINIVGTGQATIFIDNGTRQASPGVAASSCPTTTTTVGGQAIPPGSFNMQQNSSINAGGSALKAQILVYGDQSNPGTNTVNLTNNASSSFALVAPFSTINVSPSNNSLFRGAIAGYNVTLGNKSHFTYEADTSGFQTSSVPIYYESYWEQCPPLPSAQTNPSTGC
ncbi:MAG TPA: hypothetical protein VMU90_08145 [Solirubrobacteraceae bacterium]|nr:hypothetical protein [Solirubrobacteraceae bacterium]